MKDITKGEPLHKRYSCTIKAVDDDKKVITFMGTTASKDRDGDIIVPEGAEMSNFRKNPVFLYGHRWREVPIGKSIEERIMPDKGIEFDIKFDQDDEFAMKVYNKYKNGFMNAVSVGFSPKEWERMRDENDRIIGYKFLRWELLELSAVPIPANPEALQRMAKGLEDDIEKEIASMIDLDELAEKVAEKLQKDKEIDEPEDIEEKKDTEDDTEKDIDEMEKSDLEIILETLGTDDPEEALQILAEAEEMKELNELNELENQLKNIADIAKKTVKDRLDYLAGKVN